ncbi:phosphotransferase [Aliiroseovarius sediminis]|uniref:phosphotransferase n=1 Tax=Aliiroseovarius sediminis TaxID=2925839 RepID=UPI001F5A2DFD|nr:phosphotransferase [Aliiroseovarius sediminis]MCI2394738.1 phosphotransferase [Aliiroseovarius sediminis]
MGTATRSQLQQLKHVWVDAGIIPDTACWTALTGGRTNLAWKVQINARASFVCKLFVPNTATPIFANNAVREVLALRTLSGKNIAPNLVAFQDSSVGESLVYKHLTGGPWRDDVTPVAKLMARLHEILPPDGLPTGPVGPAALVADGLAMIDQMPREKLPSDLRQTCCIPADADLPAARRVFVHGDIVPGNILDTPDGLRLIDWQCPSIGDPSLDIAMFLSPAMQVLYGHRPLTIDEVACFLNVYQQESGDEQTVTRYRALAPLYHWRMAIYCHWKASRGDHDYAAAAAVETALLQKA